jgi:ribosomal protein S27AE
MNAATRWQAGEDCPECGAPLILLDDGPAQARVDCGSCGYADTWTVSDLAGGGGR